MPAFDVHISQFYVFFLPVPSRTNYPKDTNLTCKSREVSMKPRLVLIHYFLITIDPYLLPFHAALATSKISREPVYTVNLSLLHATPPDVKLTSGNYHQVDLLLRKWTTFPPTTAKEGLKEPRPPSTSHWHYPYYQPMTHPRS